jgi:hypothetical protein
MRKAKIRIEFGHDLIHTIISVDGVTRPYKSVDLHLGIGDEITCTLTRNIGDDGFVTEELLAHPIVETFECVPFEPVVGGHGPGINYHVTQELPPNPATDDVDTHRSVEETRRIVERCLRVGMRI